MESKRKRHGTLAKATDERHPFDAAKVLAGLAPKLVITLAQLVGASLEDLQVTVQLLPWGDRATLAAYRVIEMDSNTGPGRKVRVLPECQELTYAAAELVAEAVQPRDVAMLLNASSTGGTAALPSVSLAVASSVAEQDRGDVVQVPGVVTEIHREHGYNVLTVELESVIGATVRGLPDRRVESLSKGRLRRA